MFGRLRSACSEGVPYSHQVPPVEGQVTVCGCVRVFVAQPSCMVWCGIDKSLHVLLCRCDIPLVCRRRQPHIHRQPARAGPLVGTRPVRPWLRSCVRGLVNNQDVLRGSPYTALGSKWVFSTHIACPSAFAVLSNSCLELMWPLLSAAH